MKENKQEPVINFIIENINNGKYKFNTKIMSEPLLVEKFNVSRTTVRSALDKLVKEGYIYKVHGSGNYVKKEVKKNILIITSFNSLLKSNFYIKLINMLKEEIIKLNYIPYILGLNDNEFNMPENLNINSIAGVITCLEQRDYLDIFEENNIPITQIMQEWNEKYPGVTLKFIYFLDKTFELIKKYNFKKLLIIELKEERHVTKFFREIGYYNYLIENFDFLQIDLAMKKNKILNIIEEKLNSLDYIPDVIVFTDDNLYNICQNIFEKYSNIFLNTKIITHSNNNEIYDPKYNICRIAYKIEDFVNAEMKLLMQLINRENLIRVNYNILPTIINEDKLIKN